MPDSMYDHCGKTSSKEMMKAWDGPKEQGKMAEGESRDAGKVANVGGMKSEAGQPKRDAGGPGPANG